MSGHTYTYEGGRCINRDGEPFVSVHRSLKPASMGGGGYADPEDCDTFARLCAAAPEMLVALKATLRALEAHLDSDTNHAGLKHRDMLCPCNQNEVAQARAIIRRAEGGE